MPASLAIVPSIENTPSVAIEPQPGVGGLLELRFEVGHVVVLVAQPLRLATAARRR